MSLRSISRPFGLLIRARLARVLGLSVGLGLIATPAAADAYLFDPLNGSVTLGVIWLLLLAAGTIAVWGSRVIVYRVLRGRPSPPAPSPRALKPIAVTLAIGWIVLSGFFWLIRGRGIDVVVVAFSPWPVVAALLGGTWIGLGSLAQRVFQKRLPRARLGVVATVAFACCLGACIVLGVESRASLQRRVAEPQAIGDIRTMLSAQAAYQSSNAGLFDGDPRCLAAPWNCIPGYSRNAPTFVPEPLGAMEVESNGYRRTFHPGPRPASLPMGSSPSSVEGFAYTAVPMQPGKSGVRGFCADATGVICVYPDGRAPVVDGRCLQGCPVLR